MGLQHGLDVLVELSLGHIVVQAAMFLGEFNQCFHRTNRTSPAHRSGPDVA